MDKSFTFDTLAMYASFNHKIFLQHWTVKKPRRSFQNLETSSSHEEVVAYSNSSINTRLNERLDVGWHDSNLENKLR